jgi:hypothetical protein
MRKQPTRTNGLPAITTLPPTHEEHAVEMRAKGNPASGVRAERIADRERSLSDKQRRLAVTSRLAAAEQAARGWSG